MWPRWFCCVVWPGLKTPGSPCSLSLRSSWDCRPAAFSPLWFLININKLFITLVHYFMWMYVCAPHGCLVPAEVRGGHWTPRTRVMNGHEPPRACWESNMGPLQEQPVLNCSAFSPGSPNLFNILQGISEWLCSFSGTFCPSLEAWCSFSLLSRLHRLLLCSSLFCTEFSSQLMKPAWGFLQAGFSVTYGDMALHLICSLGLDSVSEGFTPCLPHVGLQRALWTFKDCFSIRLGTR